MDMTLLRPGVDSYHLTTAFRATSFNVLEPTDSRLLSKKELEWFDKAASALEHKAKNGTWGKFTAWANNVRKARNKGGLLSVEQIKYLKDNGFSFSPDSNKGVGGRKTKKSDEDWRCLKEFHARRDNLSADENSQYLTLLKEARAAYQDCRLSKVKTAEFEKMKL